MAEVAVNGNLELEIDSRGITAQLVFTPDKEATGWTADGIQAFMAESSLEKDIPEAKIKDAYMTFKKAATTVRFTVAKGLEPEDPVPETVEWEEIAIPKNLIEDSKKCYSAAASPRIVIEKTETYEVEKLVTIKPKFPFMAEKKEKQTVKEKRTVEERVYIDPTVEKTGFALEGVLLGKIKASQPGTPGKSLTGKVVQPKALGDPYFYAGSGVDKRGDELVTKEEGFVRIGSNWVDVIPFSTHRYKISISSDKATCYLDFTPGHKLASLPDPQEIKEKAVEAGYPEEQLLSHNEIHDILQSAVDTGEALCNKAISSSTDAFFEVRITDDKLKAELYLRKGRGNGKQLVLKEVGAAILAKKLVGLNFDQIKKDLAAYYNSEEVILEDYLLSEGKAPTEGAAQELEDAARWLGSKEANAILAKSEQNPDALASITSIDDFPLKEVKQIAFVEKEQRIFTITPSTVGEPGKDVHGETMPGLQGKELNLEIHENINTKDHLLIAAIDGILEYGKIDDHIHMRIRPYKDADISISITPDKMQAFATLFCGEGVGSSLSIEAVQKAIAAAGIKKGLKEDIIQKAVEEANKGTPVTDILIAEGKLPTEGGEEQFVLKVNLASNKSVTITKDGRADYKNRDTMTTVKKGAVLAEIIPPNGNAEDGWDISGAIKKPGQTQSAAIETGENVVAEKGEDGITRLLAACDGMLNYDKKKISIQNQHIIKGNVGVETGNVKFTGSVMITGGVERGYVVMSGGEIRVGETVETALLSADGDIMIKQGVKGGGKGILRSKKSIMTGFAEQATLLAVDDIIIKQACLQCIVKGNSKLVLQGDKGNLIGGSIRTKQGIEAANIGSPRGGKTEISFGQNYLIADQIDVEEREISKLKQQLAKLDILMNKPQIQSNPEKLKKARMDKVRGLKIIEKRGLRLFTLREKFEEHFESEIIVRGTIYPGVVIESHGRFREITDEMKSVRFYFDLATGRIMDEALKK